jgi:hypothetical protein
MILLVLLDIVKRGVFSLQILHITYGVESTSNILGLPYFKVFFCFSEIASHLCSVYKFSQRTWIIVFHAFSSMVKYICVSLANLFMHMMWNESHFRLSPAASMRLWPCKFCSYTPLYVMFICDYWWVNWCLEVTQCNRSL